MLHLEANNQTQMYPIYSLFRKGQQSPPTIFDIIKMVGLINLIFYLLQGSIVGEDRRPNAKGKVGKTRNVQLREPEPDIIFLFNEPKLISSTSFIYLLQAFQYLDGFLISIKIMQVFATEGKQPFNDQEDQNKIYPAQVEGKWAWPIRIGSFLLFIATVIINYVIGLKTGAISDKYHLFITPPGMFFLIWAIIYTSLAVVNIYNLIKNEWSKETHLWFALSNILNTVWILIFNIGNDPAVFACSFILLALVPAILKTWYSLGNRPQKSFTIWTYATRNVFAFYLGWVIAATNLNLGIDIVYWWGADKQTQLAIFWVMAPLCAIGATAFNFVQQGKVGILSCFTLWASVVWAFTGAAITSHGCLAGTLSLC